MELDRANSVVESRDSLSERPQPVCRKSGTMPGSDSRHHCVGCPGISRDVLAGLLGESATACGFDSVALEARAPLPTLWTRRYRLAFVRRGYVVRFRADPSGRTTAVDAVGPGCAFPLGLGGPGRGTPAECLGFAVSRTLICLCDAETLEGALAEGGATAIDVHRLTTEGMLRMERLADARGRSSAGSKVAALLCTLTDTLRPGDEGPTDIPSDFLQRDLAALLSIRHESVCRVLRGFAAQGVIARDADSIRVLDRPRLEAL